MLHELEISHVVVFVVPSPVYFAQIVMIVSKIIKQLVFCKFIQNEIAYEFIVKSKLCRIDCLEVIKLVKSTNHHVSLLSIVEQLLRIGILRH